jgi:hypothetical protein
MSEENRSRFSDTILLSTVIYFLLEVKTMALKDAEFVKEFCGFKTTARVYEAARLGLIPCVRIGRQVRFDEESLREWVKSGGSSLLSNQTDRAIETNR